MERFENAQTNDLVYCRQNGPGQIGEIKHGKDFPIKAYFKDCEETYTYCGRINFGDSEPLLFYRKGEERYITERPEQEINWDKEEIGTDFNVSTDGVNWTINEFCGFIKNQPVFSYKNTPNKFRIWKHIRRIKK